MEFPPPSLKSALVPQSRYYVLIVALTIGLYADAVRSNCYYPDKSLASTDTPCSSDTNSTCCGKGYACLSNKLCMATGAESYEDDNSLYVRGSCTDKSWTSVNCPLFCIGSSDVRHRGNVVGLCNNTLDEYYCHDSSDKNVNCADNNGVFFPGT